MNSNELPGVIFSPGRQQDVIEWLAGLFCAHVKVVAVGEELRKIEEFRNELANISHVVPTGRLPSLSNRVKHPVCQVKVSTLKVEEMLCEWFHPNQIAGDNHGRGVVGAIMVRRGVSTRVVPVSVSFLETRNI